MMDSTEHGALESWAKKFGNCFDKFEYGAFLDWF